MPKYFAGLFAFVFYSMNSMNPMESITIYLNSTFSLYETLKQFLPMIIILNVFIQAFGDDHDFQRTDTHREYHIS